MIRGLARRLGLGPAVTVLVVLAVACADKVAAPRVAASPRFTLRVTTTAQRTAEAQKVLVIAVYFRPPQNGQQAGDTAYFLDQALLDITGGPQQVDLKVDLTTCLADPTRHGSHDACTMYIAAFLEPSTFDPDTSEYFGASYDFQILGPFDATPGHPPAPTSIDLSNSHFAVNHWETDESLRLGGALTPEGFTGPISGAVSGTGPATLFALTQGQVPTSKPDSTFFGSILAVFQNGAWRRVNGRPGSVSFFNPLFWEAAAFSPTDAYLVSDEGAGLYHFDGTAISPITGVGLGGSPLRSVAVNSASPSPKALVAGTSNGSIWISNLTTFTKYSIPLSTVELVCINGTTEAFATSRAAGSSVYRFDGTNWTSFPTPGTGGKTDLQCLGPTQAYVATSGSPGTLYRWNGGGWTALAGPSGISGRSMNWAVVSTSEMYAVGDSASTNRAFYRFDGTSWREVGRLTLTNGGSASRIWADPRGGAAFVSSVFQGGAARVDMVTPTSASVLSYNPQLRDVAMPTTNSAFVVGANFFLARWNGARWTVDAPPAGTRTNRTLNGVWASDPANVWAVGQSSTIVRWDGARWNVSSDSIRPLVFPSDNYNAVWGAGGTTWIVGDASIVRCTAATSCALDQSGGGALYGVWGTSTTNIYAVGASGRILHFNGTSWSSMSSPTRARISRLSGSSPNDVWAAGDTVLLHFDGSSWKAVTSSIGDGIIYPFYQAPTGVFPTALWAASVREVYYGAWYGRVFRGGGPNWGENPFAFQGQAGVSGIAGPPGGCAIAIADPGRVATNGSPNLLRGVGPTGCLSTPMIPPAFWP